MAENVDKTSIFTLQKEIAELEQDLTAKKRLLEEIHTVGVTSTQEPLPKDLPFPSLQDINNSSPDVKIALLRSLFRGREDLYAKRYESRKSGISRRAT